MRNRGQVLSRRQIEDSIWNYDEAPSSNNVDVYMSKLRKKIDGRGGGQACCTPCAAWAGRCGRSADRPERRRSAISVKIKITIWYLIFMAGLAGLAVAAMLLSNSSVTRSAAMAQLEQTLRANMQQVGMQDGAFQAGEEFQYYQNGVYTSGLQQQRRAAGRAGARLLFGGGAV